MYAKFDLSPIPANAIINSAKLSFYTHKVATSCCSPFGPMAQCTKYLYTVEADWSEATINWTNKAATSSSSVTQCTNTNVPAWEEFDVTLTVNEMLAGKRGNNGFMFRCKETGTDLGITMYSTESNQQEFKPKLTVNYTVTGIINQNIKHRIEPANQYDITIFNLQGKAINTFILKDIKHLNKKLSAGVNIVRINSQKLKIIK